MPIVSRFLKKYNPQTRPAGTANVREVHVDALGDQVTRDYRTTKTEVEVIADMNALDLISTLVTRDIGEIIAWIENGNDLSAFDFTGRDITENEAEEEVLKEFARRPGDAAMSLSWWPEDLGTPQWNSLISRLSWSSELEQRVQDRSIALNIARSFYDASENV